MSTSIVVRLCKRATDRHVLFFDTPHGRASIGPILGDRFTLTLDEQTARDLFEALQIASHVEPESEDI